MFGWGFWGGAGFAIFFTETKQQKKKPPQ